MSNKTPALNRSAADISAVTDFLLTLDDATSERVKMVVDSQCAALEFLSGLSGDAFEQALRAAESHVRAATRPSGDQLQARRFKACVQPKREDQPRADGNIPAALRAGLAQVLLADQMAADAQTLRCALRDDRQAGPGEWYEWRREAEGLEEGAVEARERAQALLVAGLRDSGLFQELGTADLEDGVDDEWHMGVLWTAKERLGH